MKLLLANDDGINAPGILALAKELSKQHEVVVCAPRTEQSGMSHSLTFRLPLRYGRVTLEKLPEVEACYVEGTPADCVRFGMHNLCPDADMVVTGINNGPNMCGDVYYSGTVAAAMEAVMHGTPAVAVSISRFDAQHFETAARYAAWAVEFASKEKINFLNVNVPDVEFDEIKGVKFTSVGKSRYNMGYEERRDIRGREYYWMLLPGALEYTDADDYDAKWVNEGYVAVTPLMSNMTDTQALERLRK